MGDPYLLLVISLLIGLHLLDSLAEVLNLGALRTGLPEEMRGVFTEEKYSTSLRYQSEKTRFGLLHGTLTLGAVMAFLLLGGLAGADQLARKAGWGSVGTGLLFFAILGALRFALSLPFRIWDTFVIEERHGFNRTTAATFVSDLLKGLLLSVVLGGPILALLLLFFERSGSLAWAYAWAAMSAIQILLVLIAPAVILPLFNRFEPLPEGALKEAIRNYARSQNFTLSGIFRMDGSKRSSKSNAFFTGFGRFRRLALFDTLIERHPTDELVAVLAHEIGHFKHGHILKSVVASILSTGLLFRFLAHFIGNASLTQAFGLAEPTVYASLVLVSFLYAPVSRGLSIALHYFSRKHEFEADAFAARTTGSPETLISALRKLSLDNLSHLTPHPLKVALDYTHPPVVQRIRALRSFALADERRAGAG